MMHFGNGDKLNGAYCFSVSWPSVWNTLLDYLRNPILSIDTFESYLKHLLFCSLL